MCVHYILHMWYYVREHFCELRWRYYQSLMTTVMVGDAQTTWFRFGIGVFQWYTTSTIVFNAGFNTSFEQVAPLEKECGFNSGIKARGCVVCW